MRDQTDRDLERLLTLDSTPGPAQPTARSAAIIAGALAGAGFGPAGGGGGGGGGAAAGRIATGKLALFLVGGLAMVAVGITVAVVTRTTDSAPVIATVAPAPAGVAVVPPPVVDAADVEDPADVVEPDEIEMPAVTGRPRAHEKPEDLLAEANAERAGHRWRAADAIYRRVVKRAPRTLAAQTALVASASLHLEHLGDARGAARRFRSALATSPRGALAEDARWGLAEAARALGDAAAERAALDDFLAHHAGSPLAPRARERRGAL